MTESARSDRFAAAIAAIDAANAGDPITITYGGVDRPKEPLHARMMTEWLDRLDPDADELRHLAARAHHFRRWTRPRSDYPEGRSGYLRWRTAAKRQAAAEVAELLVGAGYDENEVERVAAIIRKEHLATDPDVQTHEDALCLVFLQTQLDGVADQLGDDATVEVLVKSIAKLSPRGVATAMDLELDDRGRALLERAAAQVAGAGSDEDPLR